MLEVFLQYFHKQTKQRKQIFYTSLGALFIFGVLLFLHWKFSQKTEFETKFAVTKPWRETVDIKKDYVAQIKAVQHIELRSMEMGYLQKIYVKEGQFVSKGQKMFEIMPTFLEAEFNKSSAEFRQTKIEYDNTLALQQRKIVSSNELAMTKARLDKTQAQMQLAQTHLEFATVKAPFDGIMDRFHVRLGSLINEGDLLTTISDNSKMWVYFNVSEVDYLDYMESKKKKMEIPVELMLANGSIFPQIGTIDTIEADFNNETGNVAFRATFANPERLLRHGETGNILLTKKYENALIIPQKATFEVLDKKFVYVLDAKNVIHDREIKVLAQVPYLFIISSGLKENERILLDGLGKVRAGQKIQFNYQTPAYVKKNLQLIAS